MQSFNAVAYFIVNLKVFQKTYTEFRDTRYIIEQTLAVFPSPSRFSQLVVRGTWSTQFDSWLDILYMKHSWSWHTVVKMSPVKAKLKHRCMFPKFYFTIFPCPQITACDSTLTIEGDMMPKPTIIRPCKPDKKPLKTNIAVTSNEATIKFHCGGSGDECNLELHWEAIEKSSAVRCNELSFWHCY